MKKENYVTRSDRNLFLKVMYEIDVFQERYIELGGQTHGGKGKRCSVS